MRVNMQAWLREWHGLVERRDLDAITNAMANDITIGAPPYWRKLEGRPVCGRLIGVIIDTIPDFAYYREWVNGQEVVLEFKGHVGELGLQGVDILTVNDEGKIQNLDVMIRPFNALMELMTTVRDKMQAKLAELE